MNEKYFLQKNIDRFWRKVDVKGKDDCWLWKRGLTGSGYGGFSIGLESINAHVYAMTLHLGRKPKGFVCHTCDVRSCCNYNHLYEGTLQSNINDMDRRGRRHDRRGIKAL